MQIYNGDKFYYKHSNKDELNFRVVRIKNENTFNCLRNDGNLIKISRQDLEDNYIRITPHGTLFISIVDMGDRLQDVILSLFRMQDFKEKANTEPWCVCRQHISDIFSETMNNNPYLKYSGVSLSHNTIPEGQEFQEVLACNGILDTKKYSVYLDDTMEDILYLVDKKYRVRLDDVLGNLYSKMNDDFHTGYNETLVDLIDNNDFVFDYLEAWGIQRVSFKVTEFPTEELLPNHRFEVEGITSCEMLKTYVVPFDYKINISQIKRSHQFICDVENKIYIIAYDKGEHLTESFKSAIKRNNDIYSVLKKVKENNKKQ